MHMKQKAEVTIKRKGEKEGDRGPGGKSEGEKEVGNEEQILATKVSANILGKSDSTDRDRGETILRTNDGDKKMNE